jgi:hypothetical protein
MHGKHSAPMELGIRVNIDYKHPALTELWTFAYLNFE